MNEFDMITNPFYVIKASSAKDGLHIHILFRDGVVTFAHLNLNSPLSTLTVNTQTSSDGSLMTY